MVYGYARISTNKQKIERQIDNIKNNYSDAIIFEEVFTGTKINRTEFDKLLKIVYEGDTIVFDEVSRMSRNADEGFALYQDLYNKGIELVFLKEPHINTSTYRESQNVGLGLTGNEIADLYIDATNKVLLILAKKQIELAFETAEKEVEYLHQRTREGIAKAKAEGKQVGISKGTKLTTKKSVSAKEMIRKYSKEFGGTLNNEETAKLVGISRNSFYKYRKELLEELQA